MIHRPRDRTSPLFRGSERRTCVMGHCSENKPQRLRRALGRMTRPPEATTEEAGASACLRLREIVLFMVRSVAESPRLLVG